MGASPRIAAPTILRWEDDPRAHRYDAVRGDLGALRNNKGSVDLGEVVCLENDTRLRNTALSPDLLDPGDGTQFADLGDGYDAWLGVVLDSEPLEMRRHVLGTQLALDGGDGDQFGAKVALGRGTLIDIDMGRRRAHDQHAHPRG